jgi:hypothetical protein
VFGGMMTKPADFPALPHWLYYVAEDPRMGLGEPRAGATDARVTAVGLSGLNNHPARDHK